MSETEDIWEDYRRKQERLEQPVEAPAASQAPPLKGHLLPLLGASVGCLFLGYLTAFTLASVYFNLVTVNSPGWTPSDKEFIGSVIGNLFIQLICGLPLLFPVGLTFLSIAMALRPRARYNLRKLGWITAAVSFTVGFILYFPLQVLFLFGAAL